MIANGKNHVKNYALFIVVQELRGAKKPVGQVPGRNGARQVGQRNGRVRLAARTHGVDTLDVGNVFERVTGEQRLTLMSVIIGGQPSAGILS